jgi:hypothetical protein
VIGSETFARPTKCRDRAQQACEFNTHAAASDVGGITSNTERQDQRGPGRRSAKGRGCVKTRRESHALPVWSSGRSDFGLCCTQPPRDRLSGPCFRKSLLSFYTASVESCPKFGCEVPTFAATSLSR